jgi:hypothetical protein
VLVAGKGPCEYRTAPQLGQSSPPGETESRERGRETEMRGSGWPRRRCRRPAVKRELRSGREKGGAADRRRAGSSGGKPAMEGMHGRDADDVVVRWRSLTGRHAPRIRGLTSHNALGPSPLFLFFLYLSVIIILIKIILYVSNNCNNWIENFIRILNFF